MPILKQSSYKAPFFVRDPHLQTLFTNRFPLFHPPRYERRRISTHDGDFLDLDWARIGSKRLAILTHGLEGSSRSSYIQRFTTALNHAGYDVLAWNMRGCGGEPNRLLRWYHAGDSHDLRRVFSHALFRKRYAEIVLVGFSLGGNIVLKFLGEYGLNLNTLI